MSRRPFQRALLLALLLLASVAAACSARHPTGPTPSPTPEPTATSTPLPGPPRIVGFQVRPYYRVDLNAADSGFAAYVVDQDVTLEVMVVQMDRIEVQVQRGFRHEGCGPGHGTITDVTYIVTPGPSGEAKVTIHLPEKGVVYSLEGPAWPSYATAPDSYFWTPCIAVIAE